MVVGQIAEAADFVVVGAGPGGYAAALRAAQAGRRVTLIDRDGADGVGGVCLRVGCIPSKALIEVADLAARLRDADTFGLRTRPGTGGVIDMKRFQKWKAGVVGGLTDGVRGLLKQRSARSSVCPECAQKPRSRASARRFGARITTPREASSCDHGEKMVGHMG